MGHKTKTYLKTGFIFVFITKIIFITQAFGQTTSKSYAYEPAIVELSGTIVKETKYGPPNFGETPKLDRKEKIFVLRLDSPINVNGDSNSDTNQSSFIDVKEVQLVHLTKMANWANTINKHVQITGTLFQSFSGNHYTDVLMTVKVLKP
jgi:hypothetical protein